MPGLLTFYLPPCWTPSEVEEVITVLPQWFSFLLSGLFLFFISPEKVCLLAFFWKDLPEESGEIHENDALLLLCRPLPSFTPGSLQEKVHGHGHSHWVWWAFQEKNRSFFEVKKIAMEAWGGGNTSTWISAQNFEYAIARNHFLILFRVLYNLQMTWQSF